MMNEVFKNVIGQEQAKLAITDWYVNNEPQPLLILAGSGYGKTNFARALNAKEVDSTQIKNGNLDALTKPLKLAKDGDIILVDEFHSLGQQAIEALFHVIDTHCLYNPELCVDIPLKDFRLIFCTNLISRLPEAILTRCKIIELEEYTEDELAQIVQVKNPNISIEGIQQIVKASKGTPRIALSLANSVISGAKTEHIDNINKSDVDNILSSRLSIHGDTGLNEKEFKLVKAALSKGRISTTACATLLHMNPRDVKLRYIEPLRASDWIAVTNSGVIPGVKAHMNYDKFLIEE